MNVRENKKVILYITPLSFDDNEIQHCTSYFHTLPDHNIFKYLPQTLAIPNHNEKFMYRAYTKLEDAHEALDMSYNLNMSLYGKFRHFMIAMVEVSEETLKSIPAKQCHFVITDGLKKLEYTSSDSTISQNRTIPVYDDIPKLKLEINDFLRLYHRPFRDKDRSNDEGYAIYPICPLTHLDMTDSDQLSNRKKQLYEKSILLLQSHEKSDSEISRLQIELVDRPLHYLGNLLNIPDYEIIEIIEKAKNSLKKPEMSSNIRSSMLDGMKLFQKRDTQCQADSESEEHAKREHCRIN